jgi:SAM-dependent methyltransferase
MLEAGNKILKTYLDLRAQTVPHFNYPVSREHYLQRCWPVISRILTSNENVTVVDAGCGHAYESILFAALGAEVIGIDLREDGFQVALKNIEDFRSTFHLLRIHLINRDIFAAMQDLDADVIFVRQAFSHIHPAEDFVNLAYRRLKRNGILVINDSNWINPLELIEVTIEHWQHGKLGWFVTDKYRDPITKEVVPYAVERMMSPTAVRKMLRASGFAVEDVDLTGFLPISIASRAPRMALGVEAIVKRLPVISRLGAEYTITGIKN